MANRTRQLEKNRDKVVQDRLQLLLTRLLQDEDNKYCVDCDSKGPRWASWNIGIFLCIRCAGIHRNLGVHISKVKSVNLDSWTPQQVASMQVMGNSKGRAVYEAGLAEDHRRPQSDQALETFIRSKYEKKKYVAREWTPSKPPDLPLGWAELIEAEKQKKDIRGIVLPSRAASSLPSSKPDNNNVPVTNDDVPAKQKEGDAAANKKEEAKKSSASEDLLGLMTNGTGTTTPIAAAPSASLSSNLDLLCLGGGPRVGAAPAGSGQGADFSDFVGAAPAVVAETAASASTARNDIGDFDFGAAFSSSSSGGSAAADAAATAAAAAATTGGNQMSKDSIMALFNKPPSQLPVANLPPQIPASFGGPSPGAAGFSQFQQQSLGISLMNPQAQLGQFGGQAQPAMPPAVSPNNPFSVNAQTDLGFGTMGAAAAKSPSWGFAQ